MHSNRKNAWPRIVGMAQGSMPYHTTAAGGAPAHRRADSRGIGAPFLRRTHAGGIGETAEGNRGIARTAAWYPVHRVQHNATPGEYVVPNLLAQFLRLYPGVDVQMKIMNSDTVEECLSQGHCDIGFLGREPGPACLSPSCRANGSCCGKRVRRRTRRLRDLDIRRELYMIYGANRSSEACRTFAKYATERFYRKKDVLPARR